MATDDEINLQPTLEEIGPVKKVFRVASGSRPGMFHYTFVMEDGTVDCTCEGWRMNRKCWHTTEVGGDDLDGDFSVSID